jgi:uncharacterized protein YjbI with pentapeptide repeats
LIIPLFLAGGAFFLNRSERALERKMTEDRTKEDRKLAEDRANLEREIATDRQQEAALQSFLDRMSELLLHENLRGAETEEVSNVARTRTLTILRGLDGKRKGIVLRFLYEAQLLTDRHPLIRLDGADFSGADLSGALFMHATLHGINLANAILNSTHFVESNLDFVNLTGATGTNTFVSMSSLTYVQLRNANLIFATFDQVNLSGADLQDATFERSILRNVNLQYAHLEGAIMPDGTIHD